MALEKIIEFQNMHGISPVAAVVGPKTLKKMKSLWGISNNQLSNFLGQTAHETLNFSEDTEKFNYSLKRFLEVFKSRLDTNKDKWLSESEKQKAYSIIGNRQKIANFVYANRMGNGNESSGDGWRFRGRGAIHLTGREMYELFTKWLRKKYNNDAINVVANPDAVATSFFWDAALFYFEYKKLWTIATDVSKSTTETLGIKINGGTNGMEDRIAKTNYYNSLVKQHLA